MIRDFKVHIGRAHPTRHRRRGRAMRAVLMSATRWLLVAWAIAFPSRAMPPGPGAGPVPPLAAGLALREGALLYEVDGEPVSKTHAA
jgi:hypothetical protein